MGKEQIPIRYLASVWGLMDLLVVKLCGEHSSGREEGAEQ